MPPRRPIERALSRFGRPATGWSWASRPRAVRWPAVSRRTARAVFVFVASLSLCLVSVSNIELAMERLAAASFSYSPRSRPPAQHNRLKPLFPSATSTALAASENTTTAMLETAARMRLGDCLAERVADGARPDSSGHLWMAHERALRRIPSRCRGRRSRRAAQSAATRRTRSVRVICMRRRVGRTSCVSRAAISDSNNNNGPLLDFLQAPLGRAPSTAVAGSSRADLLLLLLLLLLVVVVAAHAKLTGRALAVCVPIGQREKHSQAIQFVAGRAIGRRPLTRAACQSCQIRLLRAERTRLWATSAGGRLNCCCRLELGRESEARERAITDPAEGHRRRQGQLRSGFASDVPKWSNLFRVHRRRGCHIDLVARFRRTVRPRRWNSIVRRARLVPNENRSSGGRSLFVASSPHAHRPWARVGSGEATETMTKKSLCAACEKCWRGDVLLPTTLLTLAVRACLHWQVGGFASGPRAAKRITHLLAALVTRSSSGREMVPLASTSPVSASRRPLCGSPSSDWQFSSCRRRRASRTMAACWTLLLAWRVSEFVASPANEPADCGARHRGRLINKLQRPALGWRERGPSPGRGLEI